MNWARTAIGSSCATAAPASGTYGRLRDGPGPGAACERQAHRRGDRRAAAVLLEDPAGVRAALAEGDRGAPDPLPARPIDRRLRPALEGLLGEDACGLSASTISRLCKEWGAHHERFRKRLLSVSRYAYLFVDGVHVSVRLGEDDKLCLLVVIGVREDGIKELLAVEDGYRESTDSWAGVLRDLKRRGLNCPKLVIGDGALGTWAALRDVFPEAGEQRCWVHKTANVLDCLPKRLQPRAKGMLHEIVEAATRTDAKRALEVFREEFGAKYPKALAKLDDDWKPLTAFYDFPAEHWRHLRTTNPIESSFATVKLRTRVTKGAGSKAAALAMAYKLLDAAQERWRRFNGHELIADVLNGATFKDGVKVTDDETTTQDERVAA
jgi:putative transposase